MRRRHLITGMGALLLTSCAPHPSPTSSLPQEDVSALVADLEARAKAIRAQPLQAELVTSVARADLPPSTLHDVLVGLHVATAVRGLDERTRSHPDLVSHVLVELSAAGRGLVGLARWVRRLDRPERKRLADLLIGDEAVLGQVQTDLRVEGERAGVPADRFALLDQALEQLSWNLRKQGPDSVCDELVAVTEKASEAEGLPVASWDDVLRVTPSTDGAALTATLVAQLTGEQSDHGAPEAVPVDDQAGSLALPRSARMARLAGRMFGLSLATFAVSGVSILVGAVLSEFGGPLVVGGVLGLTAGVVLAIMGIVYLGIAGTSLMTEGPKAIEVQADGLWHGTGLQVGADRTLVLEVTGVLTVGALSVGPAGVADALPAERLLDPALVPLALIGQVSAERFFVGETPVDPPAQGELFLAVNALADPRIEGSFTVRLTQ
ncbi:MAG: hypothetical protein H6738_18480 [Alphaproteobacteria bacterium]|nr:hypothetical protein [Alphaproteobacteria bacterium]